ncbi:MAG TPA: hypothetical protein PLP29_20190, partial [Candidatus Ozemobacteraceae bacterium]|nr:hypothetical protein [Candidatus Ozemobacteraceae bacterium]
EEAHIAEVERGFICLGVTGTMWTLVLSGWVAKVLQISHPDSQNVLTSLSHLAVMYALYLLPWFCFAWWVAEPAVKRGIYAGAGISLVAVPLAYHGYHHSLSSAAWWQILLSPGGHLAALTFFVATAFLFWWVRPTPASRGSGILSGFYLVAIPAIVLLPGVTMTYLWHPQFRSVLMMATDAAAILNLLHPLIQKLLLFGPALFLLVFLAAIFGGARATPAPAEPASPSSGSPIVAASGSQTFTVLLGLLLPIPIIAAFLTQHVALGPAAGNSIYMHEYILSMAIYFPLLFADAFVFAGLWSAGPFIAFASRLPHPRMAGAALLALQSILIWGFDPRQRLVAVFIALLAVLLVLKKLFGETIDEARRSLLDFQRFVIWSCFLGMPILFLSNFFVIGFFIQSQQIFNIARLIIPTAKQAPIHDLIPYLHPGAFWTAYPALTAAIGLVLLLGLPLLCLPLYLYPLFKDQKAAESGHPNPVPIQAPDQPPADA